MTITSFVTLAWFFCWVIVGLDGIPTENKLVGPFGNKPACERVMYRAEAKGLWVGQCERMWMDIHPMTPRIEKDERL